MNPDNLKTCIAREFGTPAVVVDLDVVDRNIARVQGLCDAAGIANRPHVKTHKCVALAKLQREAGARGITCQKLGEAEVMAAGGLDDILISYNLIGEHATGRLGRLLEATSVTVAADSPTTVEGLQRAGEIAGRPLPVVVECDTGRKRAGVVTPGEAIELALQITRSPHLSFAGLMFYPTENSWPETQQFHDAVRTELASNGITFAVVSTGGTPNLANIGRLSGATEHRAGTSIFNDRMMIAASVARLEDCALQVYSTVVSRAAVDRGIIDAGSKTLTSDQGGLDGYGLIREHPNARIEKFAEEHGFLDLRGCNEKPGVGEIVRIVPNHVCVVVNMVDRLIAVRGEEIVGELTVDARGRIS